VLLSKGDDAAQVQFVADNMKRTLESMVKHVFGDVETKWVDEFFPFTDPSFELEIFYQGKFGIYFFQSNFVRRVDGSFGMWCCPQTAAC
jgi:phenylalanyl-tRNA synthetase alpha subunit